MESIQKYITNHIAHLEKALRQRLRECGIHDPKKQAHRLSKIQNQVDEYNTVDHYYLDADTPECKLLVIACHGIDGFSVTPINLQYHLLQIFNIARKYESKLDSLEARIHNKINRRANHMLQKPSGFEVGGIINEGRQLPEFGEAIINLGFNTDECILRLREIFR